MALILYTLFSCLHVLILTQSKSGFLGLLLALVLILPYTYKRRKSYKLAKAVALVSIVTSILSVLYLGDFRGEKLYTDSGVRLTIFKVSAHLVQDNPLMGLGAGSFEKNYLIEHNKQLNAGSISLKPVKNLHHPHNETVFWIVEGGMVSLLGIVLLTLTSLQVLYQGGWGSLPKLALLMPILLHSQTEFPFYHSALHFIYFLVFLFFFHIPKESIQKHVKYEKITQTILVLFFTFSFGYFATALQTHILFVNFIKSNDLKYVEKIFNQHALKDELDERINQYHFEQGLINKDAIKIRSYIDWAKQRTQREPRLQFYQNSIEGFLLLKEWGEYTTETELMMFVNEAKQLYPGHPFWQQVRKTSP
ncbi:Wzy polymerase domain-containing protein [Thalassotalea aquiviva]|uniref:PglL family O-oligosaccharyltransferase n=1 Tax=Thalassotalea aquiviva TaxID=3242415 RepID=UPI00352B976A